MQIQQLWQAKADGQALVALTASDYAIASLLDAAGIDLILVGDSLAMTTLGYATTLPLTLDALVHHCAAVRRGVTRAFLVADLPFMSYQVSPAQALTSAGRVLKEAGANAVKLEGGYPHMITTVATLVEAGIPVMGHIGLTPQAIHQMGLRQQGQTEAAATQLHTQAQALAAAGAFAIVLEHIPAAVATAISESLTIPTFGIGAGQGCDGQILVTHDLLGLSERLPPFAKAYTDLRSQITTAVQAFAADVRSRQF